MSTKNTHNFSADRPIHNTDDDLLGRGKFAKYLAEAISSWHGNDSLVIALHGEWGAGKTSLKNMALTEVSKNRPCKIIEFSPWEWAAQEKITASFFNEISSSLRKSDQSKNGQAIAKLLRRYGRYLNTGEAVTSALTTALPYLFSTLLPLAIGAATIASESFKIFAIATMAIIGAWAAFLKWGGNLFTNLEAATKDAEQSSSDIRENIIKLLKQQENPIIIVLDDLDRLTTEQIRMVVQLVKANANFPNVVYILLFQRDIVEQKLTDGSQSGRDFLEKIIQIPFDIPAIEKTTVHDVLFRKLNQILDLSGVSSDTIDEAYWGNIFYGSLFQYFDNLRNVYRFTSTLSFQFSLLHGRTRFEVNPVDLIAIECLRVFEPDVYVEISRSKDLLTHFSSEGRNGQQLIVSAIEVILSKANDKHKIKDLIDNLFPNIKWAFGGTFYSNSFIDGWLREARICHPSVFDRYFQFAIPVGGISSSDLSELLEFTSNHAAFADRIKSLHSKNLSKVALLQFESFVEEIPIPNAPQFILAVLNVGDFVGNKTEGFLEFSANFHCIRLAITFLLRISDQTERDRILLEAFESTDSLSIVEHILQSDENRRQKKGTDDFILSEGAFENLKKAFVSKVNLRAKEEGIKFLSFTHFSSILYRWSRWGDADAVKAWVNAQIQNDTGLVLFLQAFIRESKSFGFGDRTVKITKYIKLDEICLFVSEDLLDKGIDRLNAHCNIDENAKNAIALYYDAKSRKAED